jgi:hypothetical protein
MGARPPREPRRLREAAGYERPPATRGRRLRERRRNDLAVGLA